MPKQSHSLFDQTIDRSVFITYFLGAIVPLIGFAVLSERISPSLTERNDQLALAGVVIATVVLCLGSYLALRRIVERTVENMGKQNQRLESLLLVAKELAEAPHAGVVAESASCWAQRLTEAEACWVLSRDSWEKPFVVASSRGDRAQELFDAHHEEWAEMMDRPLQEDETLRIETGGQDSLSFVLTPIKGEGDASGLLVIARSHRAFDSTDVDALRTLAAQASVALTNAERGDSQRNFFSHMTDLVIAALDTHIEYRAGHASRVAEVANRVGRTMGLEERALHDLHFGALLHDIGMLKIPARHQRDPKHFRKHPLTGFKMLSRIRVWQDAAPIVGQHHERMDGTGYPDGLVGDDICLGARILAACDAWDAMRTNDVHRESMSAEDALAELRAHVGTQFDGDVVATIEALVGEGVL